MRLSYDIFHDFYHSEKRQKQGKSHTRYYNDTFYSYDTCIGRIYKSPVNNRTYTFISCNKMSPTTAAHIRALRDCCPYNVIYVPFKRNRSTMSIAQLLSQFKEDLINWYEASKFKYVKDRRKFVAQYDEMRKLMDVTGLRFIDKTDELLTSLYAKAAANVRGKELDSFNAEYAKKKEEEREAARKKKITKLRRSLGKAVYGRIDVCAKAAYEDDNKDARDYLKTVYPAYNSFIWVNDEGDISTYKSIKISYDICKPLYDRFVAGTLTAGMHVGPYTIDWIRPESIKIGCHIIQLENVKQVFGDKK